MEPTEVRNLVTRTLKTLGYGDAKSLGCKVLYRNNRQYAGVQFVFEGVSAIWLADSDRVGFFDGSGKLFKTVRPGPGTAKKAA